MSYLILNTFGLNIQLLYKNSADMFIDWVEVFLLIWRIFFNYILCIFISYFYSYTKLDPTIPIVQLDIALC